MLAPGYIRDFFVTTHAYLLPHKNRKRDGTLEICLWDGCITSHLYEESRIEAFPGGNHGTRVCTLAIGRRFTLSVLVFSYKTQDTSSVLCHMRYLFLYINMPELQTGKRRKVRKFPNLWRPRWTLHVHIDRRGAADVHMNWTGT